MFNWFRDLSQSERRTLWSCFGGWALDALDLQIYSFTIATLIGLWGITKTQAGELGTVTLLLSSLGGWISGMLCDRYGRVRILQYTIAFFAFFTFLSGFAQNFGQLFVCRALQGIGFGGEWAAGSVLIGEIIRKEYRGRAVGTVQSGFAIGWGTAAILYTIIFSVFRPEQAWRAMFWIGILPAILVFYVRRYIKEPEIFNQANQGKPEGMGRRLFAIFSPEYLPTLLKAVLLTTGAQGGYYAVATWLPTYLKLSRNLSVFNTGAYLFVVIVGAFFGFIIAAYLADYIGRRPTFFLFADLCGRHGFRLHVPAHQQSDNAVAGISARTVRQRSLLAHGTVFLRIVPDPRARHRARLRLQCRARNRGAVPHAGGSA